MSGSLKKNPPTLIDSGLPWLGLIPVNWQPVRGKDILVRLRRSPLPTDGVVTCFRDGQVTLRVNRRTDGFTFAAQEHGYQRVEVGNLVVSAMDAFAGAIGISDSDGKCSPVYSVCRPRFSSEVHLPFYMYALRDMASNGYISSVGKGIRERSTEFRFSEVEVAPFAFPPLPEQIAIADYLDKTTALIDKQRALLERKKALLQEHKKALIHEAVTKGLTPGVAMKPSGVDWIGDVPAGWDVIRLRDVISQSNAGEVIDKGWWGDGSENLFTCAFEPMTSSFPRFPEWKRTKGNDLLLTRNATPYVFEPAPGSIYSNVVQRIRLKKGVDAGFLAMTIRAGVDSMFSFGVSIPSFSMEVWGDLHLPLPPRPVQQQIMKSLQGTLSAYDEFDILAKKKIDLLANLKSVVIHETVTQGVPS